MKPVYWLGVIILVIIAGLAAFVAFEYLTVSIHALPSYIPGHRKGRGHYHVRGAVAALIAFVALVIAGFLIIRDAMTRRAAAVPATTTAPPTTTVDSMLSDRPGEQV